MNLIKKWQFWMIIAIALVAFLFPKYSGQSGNGFMVPPGVSWNSTEYQCFGYEYDATPTMMDAPHSYNCVGIPYGKKIIQHTR